MPSSQMVSVPTTLSLPFTELQLFTTLGKNAAHVNNEEIWMGPDDKPCLPKHVILRFAKLTHGFDHISI